MARSTNRRVILVFATVAIVTIGLVVVIWMTGNTLARANAALVRSQTTQLELNAILTWVSSAETGQRGYLLTGDERYLAPYREAKGGLASSLDELGRSAASGDLDRGTASEIRRLSEERMARLDRTLEVFQEDGREAAIAEIETDAGRRMMEQLRGFVAAEETEQQERHSSLKRMSRRAETIRTLTIVAGALVMFLFLAWAYRQISRDLREREKTQAQLAEGRQRLEGIVASAMDAIISVDDKQNIVLFNAAAEKVFRCKATDVMGTPLDRLIPDRYRAAHRGHVRRFGETGQTTRAMGTSHMNLAALRADGEEFPIDASISQVEVGGQKLYTAILRDVTERRKAEHDLLRLHAELEQRVQERTADLAAANRELEAFGYSVSHDLRAPLRHVTGFVELLEKHAAATLDEKGRRYIKTIHDASRRMGNLIDDLLTLSRIGRATLNQLDVDLHELVEETIAQMADETTNRNIVWNIEKLPVVSGDPTLLRNVIMNLTTNALKYSRTRDPAVIEIGYRKEKGEVICFFRDNGVGFDMQFVDKLFGVFQRLHRPEEFEGTGIGLASVRRVIQKHGGRTWAEGALNQGATFYFSLPTKDDSQ